MSFQELGFVAREGLSAVRAVAVAAVAMQSVELGNECVALGGALPVSHDRHDLAAPIAAVPVVRAPGLERRAAPQADACFQGSGGSRVTVTAFFGSFAAALATVTLGGLERVKLTSTTRTGPGRNALVLCWQSSLASLPCATSAPRRAEALAALPRLKPLPAALALVSHAL